MERIRFFSKKQKQEHSSAVGEGCEWETSKGQRCENKRIEADHVVPFSKGGETEEENMLMSCLVHHALKHLLDGETYSANLIKRRMTPQELQDYEDLV